MGGKEWVREIRPGTRLNQCSRIPYRIVEELHTEIDSNVD